VTQFFECLEMMSGLGVSRNCVVWGVGGRLKVSWDKNSGKTSINNSWTLPPEKQAMERQHRFIFWYFPPVFSFYYSTIFFTIQQFFFQCKFSIFISNSRGVIERCVNVNVSLNVWLICKVSAWKVFPDFTNWDFAQRGF
jgi:hypothetical protein